MAVSAVWHTTLPAPATTLPGAASCVTAVAVSAVPRRFMKAAMARRVTGSFGQ